jgi:hypothetical protein
VQIHEFLKFLPKKAAAAALILRRHHKNLSRAAMVFENVCHCRDAIAMAAASVRLWTSPTQTE